MAKKKATTATASSEPKCSNADHANRKAVMYCSLCKAYFCDECERSVHSNKVLAHHTKYITKDLAQASSGAFNEPERCPLHMHHILDGFCPTHYVLCCLKCNLGKDGPHKGCKAVPFDEEDNLKTVHDNLCADLTALKEKADAMAGPTERFPC